jgi:hypothetical protein
MSGGWCQNETASFPLIYCYISKDASDRRDLMVTLQLFDIIHDVTVVRIELQIHLKIRGGERGRPANRGITDCIRSKYLFGSVDPHFPIGQNCPGRSCALFALFLPFRLRIIINGYSPTMLCDLLAFVLPGLSHRFIHLQKRHIVSYTHALMKEEGH